LSCNHARGNRAEHLAVFPGLDRNEADQLGEALGQLVHGVELVRFTLGTALPENLQAAFVSGGKRNGQPLRE
jgi:hypothetical protein